ncbi:MAG: radical SAM protein [Bacteroidales bacterium]
MRILWLDINASYSHSSLAIPALHAQLDETIENAHIWRVISGTQKKEKSYYISEIQTYKPDLILSTLWLFNHKYVISLLENIKMSSPDIVIVLGGPEFLGDNYEFLKKNNFINAVFRGEGEEIFHLFIETSGKSENWKKIKGFCFIDKSGEYYDNGIAVAENFSTLSPPETSVYFNWNKPFIQLESSRGCFNRCRFCVSGCDNSIRNIPVEVIEKRIEFIRSRGVKDIRILDRTFNANQSRALKLLSLFERFSDIRFHLEIHPSFLGEAIRDRLVALPPGLLHIEAGVQSLNDNVLEECLRSGSAEETLRGVEYLISLRKFDIHCDLIAGLPLYSYENLIEDLRRLLIIIPTEIQLELLKLLPGTEFRINAHKYHLRYSSVPPYEIIETAWISNAQLHKTQILSKIVELFYNGSLWRELFRDIMISSDDIIEKFILFVNNEEIKHNFNNEQKGEILYKFCSIYCKEHIEHLVFIWMKNALSFKISPGSLSKSWINGNKPENPLSDNKSTYNTYRYIETGNKRMWFLYNKKNNNFKSIKEFIEIL